MVYETLTAGLDQIWGGFVVFIPTLTKVVLVLIVATIAIRIVQIFIKRALKKVEFNEDIEFMFYKISGYAMWFLVISWMIGDLGFEEVFASMLALGALGGMAVALAAKDSINDAVAGILLLKDKHFDMHDLIETNGLKGEIIEVGLRKTRLKLEDGNIFVMANRKIDSAGWKLLKRPKKKKKLGVF